MVDMTGVVAERHDRGGMLRSYNEIYLEVERRINDTKRCIRNWQLLISSYIQRFPCTTLPNPLLR
jgi:hypothetical protein